MSDATNLQMLLEMGFSEIRAKKALAKSGNAGIEAAMDWLANHQEDPDIDDPIEETGQASEAAETQSAAAAVSDAEAKSLKCDDCGKLFRSPAEAEFHATKSGHANFSQSTEQVRQLTEEEKAEQLQQLEAKLLAKRAEREESERRDQLQRERRRRDEGKNLRKWREEAADQEMRREAEARRREKEEQKAYLAKVRQRFAQDRAEMAAREAEETRLKQQMAEGSEQQQAQAAGAGRGLQLPQAPATAPSDKCRLQIRLPGGGRPLTAEFGSKEPLAAVACYVRTHRADGLAAEDFSLMTPFPKRLFTEEDLQKPLSELDLCPSAVLQVAKAQ